MSAEWGYHCPKHDESTDTWLNHGEAKLRELWERREDIAEAIDFIDFVEAEVPTWPYGGRWVLEFLAKHADCPLLLLNEYGDKEPIEPCPPCESSISVALPNSEPADRACLLGKGHWGKHEHRTGYMAVSW